MCRSVGIDNIGIGIDNIGIGIGISIGIGT
jgi:hypothetical protein